MLNGLWWCWGRGGFLLVGSFTSFILVTSSAFPVKPIQQHRDIISHGPKCQTLGSNTHQQQRSKNMTMGPLEFAVIGCKGHQFTSEIVPELNSIQEKGLIRVVDLFFVRKDVNGTVTVLEVHDLNDEELAAFDPIKEDLMGLLTPEDIAHLTEAIPPDTSAVLSLFGHARGGQV